MKECEQDNDENHNASLNQISEGSNPRNKCALLKTATFEFSY